jgi:hypothetical protein
MELRVGPAQRPNVRVDMVVAVRYCLGCVRRGPRKLYVSFPYLSRNIPIIAPASGTPTVRRSYSEEKTRNFDLGSFKSHRRFSTDREEILALLRRAEKSNVSSEEEKEDEMFSDLPGSLSDYDNRWRLNPNEYTGSSVSDHDNWVRDR